MLLFKTNLVNCCNSNELFLLTNSLICNRIFKTQSSLNQHCLKEPLLLNYNNCCLARCCVFICDLHGELQTHSWMLNYSLYVIKNVDAYVDLCSSLI